MARRNKKTAWRDSLRNWIDDLDWDQLARNSKATGWVLGMAAVITLWILGVPRLEAHITETSVNNAPEIYFISPPAWMNGELEAWLVLTAEQHLLRNPLSNRDLIKVRAALLDTGCFEQIEQVRRISAGRIEIDAVFIQPFAIVSDPDGNHLVDAKGRLLPAGYRAGTSSHFYRIDGARFDRPQRPGLQWNGADITAGLHLIRMFDDRAWWRQIDSINVSDIDRITLHTIRNCRVIWGSAPGEESVGEVSAEQKIQRLDYIDSNFGRIDIDCPQELDITDPRVVTAR